ncbi:MAG: hypothetical protein AB7N76_26090 [Planctomycetota bacterium]
MGAPFRLERGEVGYGWQGSSSAKRRKRRNRALDRRGLRVHVQHLPTGIRLEEEIPVGHYSKRALQRLREEARVRLTRRLEEVVARALRLPGR